MSLMLLCLLVPLSACSAYPQGGAAPREMAGPAPNLVPIDGILQQADALRHAKAATGGTEARAAALRTRAARLRSGP